MTRIGTAPALRNWEQNQQTESMLVPEIELECITRKDKRFVRIKNGVLRTIDNQPIILKYNYYISDDAEIYNMDLSKYLLLFSHQVNRTHSFL